MQSIARTPTLARAIPLVLAIIILVLPVASLPIHIGKLAALSILFAINNRWGEPRIWYAFALSLTILLVSLIPVLHAWNTMVVPATAFAIVAYARRDWLASRDWLMRGQATRATWILIGVAIPLSAAALFSWAHVAQPDLAIYADMIPTANIGLIIGAAAVFALFNAIAEEVVFRGVLWQTLSTVGFRPVSVLITQAAAFGILHFEGVPSGMAGIGLATIYGLALGGVRMLSRGLLMPIVLHITADLTIFAIVMHLMDRW